MNQALRAILAMVIAATFCIPGNATGTLWQDDGADQQSEIELAGSDEHKQFFLYGPKSGAEQPEAGYKLLVVIPGGNGSRDFRGFVENIARNSTSDEFIVVQLVAPQWSDDQFKSLVWPTRSNKWKGMKFSSEDFLFAAIDEVKNKHKIDDKNVFTLSWSSGGPLAYAASLAKEKRIAGSMIAMSVFKPDELPAVAAAKGHAYYLYHSPTDFIAMSHPITARTLLSNAGAKIKVETYNGGHGWHGDVFGNIRRGVDWLQKEAAKSQAKKSSDNSGTR